VTRGADAFWTTGGARMGTATRTRRLTPGSIVLSVAIAIAMTLALPTTAGAADDVGVAQAGTIAYGQSKAINIGTPGENATFTFTGAAGDVITAEVSAATWSRNTVSNKLRLRRANGTVVLERGLNPNGILVIEGLPATERYTIEIDLYQDTTGVATLALVRPGNQAGTIAYGQSKAIRINKPGKNSRWKFTGRAGDVITAEVSAATWSRNTVSNKLRLRRGNGTIVVEKGLNPNGTLVIPALPATGRYIIEVDPYYETTGFATLKLLAP
jgi:hypothetical protein